MLMLIFSICLSAILIAGTVVALVLMKTIIDELLSD